MRIRTRFAPSPTGYLHVGGARTALFSWLYARRHGGEFILRVEDTDRERSTAESVDAILEGMSWLGLDYDQGPFFQSERFPRYREVVQRLLDSGHAYHCYCSKERLETLRAGQMANKQKPRYDGHCRPSCSRAVHALRDIRPSMAKSAVPAGATDAPVVRFRNPADGEVVMEDAIRGRIAFQNAELDDLIIARGDGTPTYNLTVVVDDSDMEISHVIRGDDHINNTPRQINIIRALGLEPPIYAHVPMILGDDGQRLSKRHGAVSVVEYRKQGYLPEALLNYLVRLGWSHGDQEIFSLDEMVALFDLEDVNRAASAFNTEKLVWLNQHYLKTADPAHVARYFGMHLGEMGIDPDAGPELTEVVMAQRERAKTLIEMAENSVFFYQDFEAFDAKAAQKHLRPVIGAALAMLKERLQALDSWTAPAIHQEVVDLAEEMDLKLGKLAQPLRVAVSGRGFSPPIDITLELVGKRRSLERLDKALKFIEDRASSA